MADSNTKARGTPHAEPGSRFQFERQGYFCADLDTRAGAPVFNRTVSLKDTWARIRATEENDQGS